MPFVTQPATIEVSDFTKGWSPDGENATTDMNALLSVLNLIPDLNTGSVVTRKGFKRLREELQGTDATIIKNLFHFITPTEKYIIAVVSTETQVPDNVHLFAIKLSNLTVTQMDTNGVTWAHAKANHWGVGIDNIWYGGSMGNKMYSWDPSGPTWTADASIAAWKSWVAGVDDTPNLTTDWPKDYAFNGKERVLYSGNSYQPTRSLREGGGGNAYPNWSSGTQYSVGDRVVLKATWASTNAYYKTFKCVQNHTADSTNKPQVGTGNPGAFWNKVTLDKPVDDDGHTTDDWDFVPLAAETSVATWHADRLFMRYDDQGDKSRLLYSAPVKPEKGVDIADVVWDPTDFAPGNDQQGQGGGWLAFNDGKHHGTIEALHSTGNYLLVFKRQAIWALSGFDDTTWNARRLARGHGIVGSRAVTEMDGLVYFLSDDGLYVTDGTTVQPVPGNEKVQAWLRTRMDTSLADGLNRDPEVWHFEQRIWISLPSHSDSTKYVTLVYDPRGGGFWYTDLPVLTAVTYRDEGVGKMAFGCSPDYGTRDLVMQYDHNQAGDQDDTCLDTYAAQDFAWQMTTSWWNFGTVHSERRIRRVWAWVKATAQTATITQYRDYTASSAASAASTTDNTVQPLEGKWMADSHAVKFKVSGTKGHAAVYGIAVETQPRHMRYHH